MSCYAQRCYDFSLLLLHLLFSQDSRAKTGQSLVLLGGFRRQEDKLIIPVKKPSSSSLCTCAHIFMVSFLCLCVSFVLALLYGDHRLILNIT